MTQNQWNTFCSFRNEFKKKVKEWSKYSQDLLPLQISASKDNTPFYPVETSVVYNSALDEVTEKDDIKLILIGDNPGKDEQLSKNNRYLVGHSGKIAEHFFKNNPELKIDFRKNVIILNKTPIHTAKTVHLKYLNKNGSENIRNLIFSTQIWMAENTAKLHMELLQQAEEKLEKHNVQLWLVGYSELKKNGIFSCYKDTLKNLYSKNNWNYVYVFQHFSMNRFLIDLKNFRKENSSLTLSDSLCSLGNKHKKEIF